MKICIVCENPLINKRSDSIYCSTKCGNKIRNKLWKNKNPDKVKNSRIERSRKIESRIYSSVKSRAKRAGIKFEIDIIDIVVPEYCPILGIKLNWNFGKGSGYHYDSPSLDKIIPELGYIKGNVRVISSRANLLKSNAYVEELELILKDLKEIGRWQKSGSSI